MFCYVVFLLLFVVVLVYCVECGLNFCCCCIFVVAVVEKMNVMDVVVTVDGKAECRWWVSGCWRVWRGPVDRS